MTIKQFTVDSVTWTKIVAPVPCNGVTLMESTLTVALKVRSDPTDATSEQPLPIGFQGTVIPGTQVGTTVANFQTNSVVCYVQSSVGTITVVAGFL